MRPRTYILLAVAIIAPIDLWLRVGSGPVTSAPTTGSPGSANTHPAEGGASCDDLLIAQAFQQHLSRVEVCGSGVIRRVLPDDTEGSRHQRLVVSVGSEHTVLIAHNIDLAPRIDCARSGTQVEFFGEYEWNERGGVVHWTHHDPSNRHPAGWFRCDGRVFQ